ncbi:MAG: GNAT family N-acetyltransferase [Streptosporangiaceae bacterium]
MDVALTTAMATARTLRDATAAYLDAFAEPPYGETRGMARFRRAGCTSVHADEWLGALCLEVVHLAVVPAVQARGLGRIVHDVLIAGRPAPTAVLTVHPAATPAQRLYMSRGWTIVTDRLPTSGPDYWLMGRRL